MPESLVATIRARRASGQSCQQISDWLLEKHDVRRSVAAVFSYCKGIAKPAPPRAVKVGRPLPALRALEDHARTIEDMRRAGYSYREIARKVGEASHETIAKFCARKGFHFDGERLLRLKLCRRALARMLWRKMTVEQMAAELCEQHAQHRKDAPSYFLSPRLLARHIREEAITADDREKKQRPAVMQQTLAIFHDDLSAWRKDGLSYRQMVTKLRTGANLRVSLAAVYTYCEQNLTNASK